MSLKPKKRSQIFTNAGVKDVIDVRIGDALKMLRNHNMTIDLLLLDGWKDLFLSLFQMLESNFHADTLIYVDNAEMSEVQEFLRAISNIKKYHLKPMFDGKVVIISVKPPINNK